MPFNLLLLPLLGGYFFIHFFYLTRFRAYRLSSYRLLFETAGAGMIFLIVSHVFVTWLSQATCFLPWIHTFKRFAPFPYSGSAVGALCLSVVAVLTLNLLVGRERSSTIIIDLYGDALMKLLGGAFSNGQAVMLTLSSGKVYVGLLTQDLGLNPDMSYITLLPTLSGYRTKDTLKVEFTVNYAEAYEAIIRGQYVDRIDDEDVDANSLQVVVPTATVASARLFDFELYRDTFDPEQTQNEP